MSKNAPKTGHSARRGNVPAPYTRADKRPYRYPWQRRLARGELEVKANDRLSNKYR